MSRFGFAQNRVFWALVIFYLSSQCTDASVARLRNRLKRQSPPRVFVVPQKFTGNLFNVSSGVPQATYSFMDVAPANLVMSPQGIVSVKTGSSLSVSNTTFGVNVTVNGSSSGAFQVAMYVVNRDMYDPIFANSPWPMWATIPVWIRPETVIYQVQAIDALYGAKVVYQLESGGEGKFDVDPDSGNVFIVGRWMFELNKVYTLAISAQIVGMSLPVSTPSQVLSVFVGALKPQFSLPVYNISFYENQTGVIYQIQAKSFQGLQLIYSMTPSDDDSANTFQLDQNTGSVTLLKNRLDYRSSVHQYNFVVTVSERYTNFVTTTTLTFNLLAVNQPPDFLVSYYVAYDIPENTPIGTTVLTVMAYDYDPGIYGQVSYVTTDSHFSVQNISDSTAAIVVADQLDYDRIEAHRYQFDVIAIDGGNLNASATVQVWMRNVNDEAPQFEPLRQSVIVKEGAQPGLALLYIQAFDPDGNNITYAYNNPDQRFSIDPQTGLLTLRQAIQPGLSTTTPSFNLSVTVTDNGTPPRSTDGYVEVIIYRVNTQPVFTQCRSYSASVDENKPINTTVLTMIAADKDIGDNGHVAFSTYTSENQEYFGVVTDATNSMAAVLFSMMTFDRENPPKDALKFNTTIKIPVTVKVQDFGSPPLSTNCILLVIINDVNDNAPLFDYNVYSTVILSSLPQGSKVFRVFATDLDDGENARITYSIAGNSNDVCKSNFAINAASGWITKSSASVLSGVSSVTCIITASDNGVPKLSTSTTVTITVTSNVDDILPEWRNYPGSSSAIDDYTGLYVDESLIGPLVSQLMASTSGGRGVGYYLQNDPQLGSYDPAFEYQVSNDSSFSISKTKTVDASQKWMYYLRCRAYILPNPDNMASIARLLVNIRDVNDKPPYFIGMDSNGIYPASISIHTQPGDWVVNVTAIDMDREYPNNLITYSFDTECGGCSNPSDFTIDPNTGEIKAAANSFKPNTDSTYTLGVIAEDGVAGGKRNRGKSRVLIRFLGTNYTSPKFDRNFTGNVVEGSPFNDTILNATVPPIPYDIAPQYGITSGNEAHRFAVDSRTGRVYVVGDINYQLRQSYVLGYRVFDGTRISTASISLTVSRSPYYGPIFGQAVYTNNGGYVENDPNSVNGVITTVNASSRVGAGVRYSLAAETDKFNVDPNTGTVVLKTPLSRDEPNGFATWQVNVIATDSSTGADGYAVVNLVLKDVNDHAPVFDTCCLWGSVPEKSASGTPVLQLFAFDPDNGSNGTVTFSFANDSTTSPFSISPSGLITLTGNTDYNNQNNYTVKVQAADGGHLSTTKSITLFITDGNDNPPIFAPPKQYAVSIPEEMDIGSSVLTVLATDADVGVAGQLTYTLSQTDAASFYADSIFVARTGVIKIARRIDYDSSPRKSTYSFTVNVRDPDQTHTDSAAVTVTVYDINDNPPVFANSSMSQSILESAPVDTSVATFSATDKDSGNNGTFQFFIDYQNTDPNFNFKVDPSSGIVRLRNKLDYEMKNYYEVHILAIDNGVPALTGTATLTINVLDANDRPPVIQIASGSKPFVPADATSGTTILVLKAADPDNSTNPTITFTYDSSCPHCSDFRLEPDPNNPNQQLLKANRNGYKRSDLQISSYNLSITVNDGTNSATYPINIVIESKDDNAPANGEKTVTVYNYARSSGSYQILPLGNVYVKDPDDWDLGYKTFTLNSKSESYFALRDRGQIVMYGNATPGQHLAYVDVVDSQFPNNPAQGTVTVNVKFINDSAVSSSGSMRLSGLVAEDLLSADGSTTKLQKLQQELAAIIGTKPEYVDIFSISNVAGQAKMVDVVYSAHGSPYYPPEKLNGLVWTNRNKIMADTQLNVTMAPVDLCRSEFQNCWEDGCSTFMNIGSDPSLVNTNASSFVGVNISFVQQCSCPSTSAPHTQSKPTCDAYPCYNSGTCILNGTNVECWCPEGFDGPRCQKTKISFSGGQSYIYLEPLENCEFDRLSLEILTTSSNALVLYNGPMTSADSAQFKDFIAIQLVDGRPQLRIDLGDGAIVLPPAGGNSLPSINDGQWHSIEVFHEGQLIRMIIDHCSKAQYNETLRTYWMDRSSCEVDGMMPGERFLLNVATPLLLGGRSDTSFNPDLVKTSLSGCVKNLQHNGELYDMSSANIRVSVGVSDKCDQDKCASCPANASCVTGISGSSICQCPPGFTGAQCEAPATVRSFGEGGYINWTLSPYFVSTLNQTSALDASLQVMFRTRQRNGIILLGQSFSSLERNILEVVNGYLQFRFDLGDGDFNLSLPNVIVSDGVWHTARVERHGNQVILQLDGGDDIYFNNTFPEDARRVLRIANLYGLGDVRLNPWSLEVTVNYNLSHPQTCIQDVRFMDEGLPLDGSNRVASVTTRNASPDCRSTACQSNSCGSLKYCYDLWNDYECRCTDNTTVAEQPKSGQCIPPVACFPNPCWNGGTCFILNTAAQCVCPPLFRGLYCDIAIAKPQEVAGGGESYNRTAAIVVPIIFGLILLVLLALLIAWCVMRRRPDYLLDYPDDDASRENVIAYDEEGAGEEDVQAYDLLRLQKPVDPALEGITRPYGVNANLKSAAPDPLSDRRLPGDYPSIGEFINDRLNDPNNDDIDQDSLRGFQNEGGGSEAGSLSSIGSSSSGDLDFGYLNDLGPKFKTLADMYGDHDDEGSEPDVSNV